MELRSDRSYPLDADPQTVWTALAAVERYRQWWPWLRRLDARALRAGERWECAVRPPAPYVLRFALTLTEVTPPRRVVATVSGDVVGAASLDITARAGGCRLRVVSVLRPQHPKLRLVAQVARPLAWFGHRWIVDRGVRQLAAGALAPAAGATPSP